MQCLLILPPQQPMDDKSNHQTSAISSISILLLSPLIPFLFFFLKIH
jgi:hypothetical protein